MFSEFLLEYKDFVLTISTGLLTLGGAAAGALLTKNKETRASRRKEIIDCYASFFRAYSAFLADHSLERKGDLVAALEIARLLFPEKTSEMLREFELMLLRNPNDAASRAKLLDQIRKQAADDLPKL